MISVVVMGPVYAMGLRGPCFSGGADRLWFVEIGERDCAPDHHPCDRAVHEFDSQRLIVRVRA